MSIEIAQDESDKRLGSEVGKQVGRLLVETQGWSENDAFTHGVTNAIYGAEMTMEVIRRSGLLVDDAREEEIDLALNTIADELGIGHRVKSTVVETQDVSRPKGMPIIG